MGCRGSLWLPLALGLLACNGDPADPGDETDGFQVTSLDPADGATGVQLHERLTATLSAAADLETITPDIVRLTLSGAPVPVQVQYDAAAHRLELMAPLLPGTTYQAAIDAGIRSADGGSLVGEQEWTFTTRPWDPAVLPTVGELGILDAAFTPDGQVHLIGQGEYYFRPGNDMPDTYVKYAACVTGCSAPGNWSRVAIDSAWLPGAGMGVDLDATGRVHLVHFSNSPAPAPDFGPAVIRYLTCSADCSIVGNWTSATIDSTPEFTSSWALTGFAVGSGGAVHLLSYSAGGGAPDLRYATCAAQCTLAANWTFAAIPVSGYAAGVNPLQIDQSGRLHLLTEFNNVLSYATCPADCTSPAQWSSRTVGQGMYGPSFLVDALGRIHLAFSDASFALRYAVCETDCIGPAAWPSVRLDQGDYFGTSLAVDHQSRVTLLNPVGNPGELRFHTCVSGCLDAANWQAAGVQQPYIISPLAPGPPRIGVKAGGGVRVVYADGAHDASYLE